MAGPELLSSVQNAIRVMRQFSLDEPELGITELNERLGISKSSIYRVLQTLCAEHIIQQNPETKKYHLGLTAFEIGCVVYNDIQVCQVALPLLQKMHLKVPVVIQLVVYDRGTVIHLLTLPEKRETRTFNRMGKRVPANATAAGKVLLAYQNEKEISRLCSIGFKSFTPNTLTEPDVLLSELETIRKNGYAFSKEEFKVGMCAMAVPVFDEMTSQIAAAISVTGPKKILSPSQINVYLSEMKRYSRLISEQLDLE
ncbi:IclR family transcriptional regulator [Domibacillus epiphyticus]|uniref:IclR family transcriptional regulator n=1 Tax=Domibacillus epiphyticus TaxID=1714355 RepID=A0A1V2ABS8_9BACI|nr:IclR family transcriptional regulator [Domibacillus epiphyticus]OMP68446.1 hypothetical protein BTO28_02160 [Domibacillus epiphyticus]